MRDEDEGRVRETVSHRIGEVLDTLSVEELGARITLLHDEIARLEAAREAKKAALDKPGSLFRF